MANLSFPLLHGIVNSTHTSDLHAFYPTGNFPTPWPLVIISSLVSLVIAVIGFKSAAMTWNETPRNAPIRKNVPRDTRSWRVRYREAKKGSRYVPQSTWQPDTALMNEMNENEPPAYELQEPVEPLDNEALPAPVPWRMFNMSTRHMIVILISFLYSTARCAIALLLSLKVVITKRGSHSAPSSLFLLLLSVQTFITNRSIPRIMNIILVLDSFFAAIAFAIASFDHRGQYYGEFTLSGGNCPANVPDCSAQSSHWNRVGCGAVIYFTGNNYEKECQLYENPKCGDTFYPPYGDSGDALSGKNVLYVMETVIAVFGAIWLITVLVTLYKCHNLFTGSWSDLVRPAGNKDPLAKTDSGRKRMGWTAVYLFSIFGIMGAGLVTVLTIAAHMAQELGSKSLVYSDSFGPSVASDFVGGSNGNMSAGYGGESWTDCFVVKTPTSGNGFWDLWFEQNVESAYRVAAAL